jgi:hypothetical protein
VVPWKPKKPLLPAHPRLQEFDGRVAHLLQGETQVGLLLVRSDAWATCSGGALWWRRWSPWRHSAMLLVDLPGREPNYDDSVVMPDDLDTEIDDWQNSRFRLYGDTYRLRWCDEVESKRLASTVFGVAVD